MKLVPSVRQLTSEMTAWRRHLHANPELVARERVLGAGIRVRHVEQRLAAGAG